MTDRKDAIIGSSVTIEFLIDEYFISKDFDFIYSNGFKELSFNSFRYSFNLNSIHFNMC